MRILFFDSIEKETWGGMEEWIRLAASGLSRRGHSVIVAGRSGSELLRRVEAGGPETKTMPLEIGGDFHPFTIAAIKRELERQRVDVIIVNFTKDIRLGGIAARLEGDTKVVWSVGLDITKDSWSHRWLTPKLIDGVIVPSMALKNQITRLGYIDERKVTVIPIGIEPAKQVDRAIARRNLCATYGIPNDSIVAVTLGRLVEQKGHAYLVQAVAQVRERLGNASFLLFGDGPLQEVLANQMTELGVRDRFVFGGMIDDVASVLPGADIMIHPSIEEPFGIALVEGMRAGLPIIATNVGGIPEVIDTTAGALVPPRESVALGTAIVKLCEARVNWDEIGEAGRARFGQYFTIDTMVDRLDATLVSLCKSESDHGQTKTA